MAIYLLDDFNRPDEPLVASVHWNADPLGMGSVGAWVLTNQCGSPGAGGANYWTSQLTGIPDEVQVDVPVLPGDGSTLALFFRLKNPGAPGATGYALWLTYNTGLAQWVVTFADVVGGAIGAPVAVTAAPGDVIRVRAEGLSLKAFHTPDGGGPELEILETIDATYGPGGYIGFEVPDALIRLDNFSGGMFDPATVVASAVGPVVGLGVSPDPAVVVASATLGSVVVVTAEQTLVELQGTVDDRTPHQVLNLREDDRRPAVLFVWREGDGEAVDFGAATVYFRMRARMADTGVYKVDTACVKLAEAGHAVWEIAAGDLDTPGEYYAYLVADYGGVVYRTSEVIVVRVWERL